MNGDDAHISRCDTGPTECQRCARIVAERLQAEEIREQQEYDAWNAEMRRLNKSRLSPQEIKTEEGLP